MTSKWYSARRILENFEISPGSAIAKIPLQLMPLPTLIMATLYLVQKTKEKKRKKQQQQQNKELSVAVRFTAIGL